jgi:hypothetical protein
MRAADRVRALAAAASTAAGLGLPVDDTVVLHDSNKLTVRLLPCDVSARVAPLAQQNAQFELDLARRLARSHAPVAALEPRVAPRVYARDGFAITLWTYYEPAPTRAIAATDYADALARLHAGLRGIELPAPHFTERVQEAQELVADRDRTPALDEAGRALLDTTLRSLGRVIGESGGSEQLLHGEPHPGNVLTPADGLLFIDLETCCRGPVEFDLAHAPDDVSEHYPGLDHVLVRRCRLLVLAMITTWRWDRDDEFPDGRRLGQEGLGRLRAATRP